MKTSLSKKEIYLSIVVVSLFCACVEKIAFSNEIFNIPRFFLMICVLCSLVLCINLVAYNHLEKRISDFYKKIGINKIFIIFALIIGIVSSVLIPLNEIPDEITHINLIYSERGLNLNYADINDGYYGTPEVMKNNSNKINIPQYFDMSKRINTGFRWGIPSITLIRHFPQYVATVISEVFRLPMVIYLALAELFALVFYVLVCNKALELIPFKKNVLMFIMLLPVCIQQMASFSYDVVLNSFCFLYFATILNLKFEKEKITGLDLLKLLLYIFIISVCKIPYGVFGILLLLLPIHKLEIRLPFKIITHDEIKNVFFKHKYFYGLIFSILLILGLFTVYDKLMSISIGRVLISSFIHMGSTITLMAKSINIYLHYYFESIVGDLGIFNIKTPIYIEIYIYFSLLIITLGGIEIFNNKNKKSNFSKFDLFVIWLVVLLMIYIIILSMFEWTLYVAGVPNCDSLTMVEIKHYFDTLPFIGGVQGRYFIPIIPLICLAVNFPNISGVLNKLSLYSYQAFYYIVLFLYFTIVMLTRFWL